eukprot:UN25119
MGDTIKDLKHEQEKLEEDSQVLEGVSNEFQLRLSGAESLRKKISLVAEGENKRVMDVLKDVNTRCEKMDQMTVEFDRLILYKLAFKMENIDPDDTDFGFSEKEYIRFRNRIPDKYKKVLDQKI